MDELDKFDDVVRAVDEEASDDRVEVVLVLFGRVHLKKIAGCHRKFGSFRLQINKFPTFNSYHTTVKLF